MFAGNLQAVAEAVLIDIEGDDPGPGFRVGLITAHGGVIPPAEDEVLAAGDREAIPAEVKVGVLECLGERHPCIDLRPLFRLKGDQQEINLTGKVGRKTELCMSEVVGGERREDGGLGYIVLGSARNGQKESAEEQA